MSIFLSPYLSYFYILVQHCSFLPLLNPSSALTPAPTLILTYMNIKSLFIFILFLLFLLFFSQNYINAAGFARRLLELPDMNSERNAESRSKVITLPTLSLHYLRLIATFQININTFDATELRYLTLLLLLTPYLSLPFLTLPYLSLSFLSFLIFPFLTLPFLSLSFLIFPYLFFPYLSLSFLTLPFLIFPYLSFPYLSFPYLSFPFLIFPYLSLPYLSFPYLSLSFLSFLTFLFLTFPFLSFVFSFHHILLPPTHTSPTALLITTSSLSFSYQAQKVLQKSEQQGRNEFPIDYDEMNPFRSVTVLIHFSCRLSECLSLIFFCLNLVVHTFYCQLLS